MGEHEHRTVEEDGTVTCECGEKFESDKEWRENHTDWKPDIKEESEVEDG